MDAPAAPAVPPPSPPASLGRLPVAVGVLAFATVLLVGLGAGTFYPFGRFDFFVTGPQTQASLLVLVDAAGTAHDLDAYRSLACDGPLRELVHACPRQPDVTQVVRDDDALARLERAGTPAAGGEPVQLVRRRWRVTDLPGPPPHDDCQICRCRAER